MSYQVYVQGNVPGGQREQWKRLVAGSGISFERGEKTLTINGSLIDDSALESLLAAVSGLESDLRIDFTNSSGVFAETDAQMRLDFSNASGIWIKTASNLGASGVGLFSSKSAADLQFKKIVTGLGLRAPIVSASSIRIQESGTINRPFRELASATGVTADLSLSNNFYIDLNHNAIVTFNNPVDGGKWLFVLRNRGAFNITFPTIKWKGGTPPTLTTGSGSIDAITVVRLAKINAYVGDASYNFS